MRVLPLRELADPGARALEIGGEAVIVVRLGAEVRAYRNRCPHTGQPLSPWPDRLLTREGDRLICFGHGALFRPEDGVCVAGPCVAGKGRGRLAGHQHSDRAGVRSDPGSIGQ